MQVLDVRSVVLIIQNKSITISESTHLVDLCTQYPVYFFLRIDEIFETLENMRCLSGKWVFIPVGSLYAVFIGCRRSVFSVDDFL